MICKKCKKRYQGQFCPQCGTPAPQERRNREARMTASAANQGPPSKPPNSRKPSGNNGRRWVLLLILGIVLAITAVVVIWRFWIYKDQIPTATFCPEGESHEICLETTQADCTQRGYITGTCQKCGYSYMYDMVNALGHQWAEAVPVKPLSCTEDGLQSKTCSRCGMIREEPLFHSGHSYMLLSSEEDASEETVEYSCSVCGDKVVRNWDDPPLWELKEKAYLPDCSEDFTFQVSCDRGESYLREKLTVTGENGTVLYNVTAEGDGIYRITAEEPYQQYETYYVCPDEAYMFPEYDAKALEFSIIGPDQAEVEFNDDNLVFLKELELREYDTSGLYELQWDEAAQRYYLTLSRMDSIDSALLGKVIGIGDYRNTEEILQDGTKELCFAKLEKISHNEAGELLLELSVPQLSEVYDKLNLYFTGGAEDIQINGDMETAFVDAVVNSEGFTEYVAAVHLAAESYAGDHGLVATPLAQTSRDNVKFELTKHSFEQTGNDSTCKLELGGKITYTIPIKTKASHASGAITMSCNAEITAYIYAGGHFQNDKSVNLYLTNSTTTTLGFDMEFNLEYSKEYEHTYLVHKTTNKIHTSTCRIANKDTDSANLQSMTVQDLSEMYNGDKEAMKRNECKVCLAVTGLDGTAYAYNRNTGVLHCINCRHVTNIKACNLYTLYPDNTFSFTTCADCRPEKRQVEDFDNRMLNAIKGSDWAEQVTEFREMLGDTIGSQKPPADTDPNLTVPINIAGVFNIEIGVAPVFEFDMEASVHFSITATTKNQYGIRSVGKGFETYHNETPGKVDYDLKFTGEANAKFGIEMGIKAYPVGCEKAASIAIKGQVGLYGRFTGIFSVEGTVGGDSNTYCAARLETGLYVKIDGYWKILWFDGNFVILKEQRLPLFKWGYDRVFYAFEEEEVEWTVDDPDEFVLFNLPMLMKAKYLDLTTMQYGTQAISPISKSHLNVTVDIKNEDGSPCDFLEYIRENGMIHKKDDAPESFTAVITVRVTPKVQIDSIEDFLASETKNLVYGYSMDPMVVQLRVEKGSEPSQTNPYHDILTMYRTSISSKWTNCDGDGWDTVGDPDNTCYMFRQYLSNYTLSEIGYVLTDINNDDQPELIVSPMNSAEGGSIYDMYTISNGEIIHVISAGERDRYNLAVAGTINNDGSSSAASGVHANYRLDPAGSVLTINHVIVYDYDDNPSHYHAAAGYYDQNAFHVHADDFAPISQEEASALLNSFPDNAPLDLTPFAEYDAGAGQNSSASDVMVAAYTKVLQGYPETSEYTLYDIDKDGVSELIVEDRWQEYDIYSLSGSEVKLCGSCYAYTHHLYAMDGNGLIAHYGGTGYLHLEYVTLYKLSGNVFEEAEVLVNTEEDPDEKITECLSQYSRITEFCSVSDLSLLKN